MNGHKLLKESGLLAKYKIDERVIPTRKQRRAVLRYLDLLEREINVGALQKKALGQLSRVYSGYRWFQKLSLNLSFAAVLGLLQGQFANADEVLSSPVNRQLATQTQDYIQAKAAADFASTAQTQAVGQAKKSVQSLHLLANQSADESYQKSLAALNNEEFFVADNSILTVIDPGVEDWEVIADAVRAGDILVLSHNAPPLQQIIDKLKTMGQVKVLNIISHGNDGEIYLTDEKVSLANLQSHQQALTELGSLLAADGQMLLFGCDLAKSDIGKAFVEKLADLTGADVAGSVNVTGSGLLSSNIESDWELEYFTGESSPSVAQTFNTKRLLAYSNVLQTVYDFSGNSSCYAYDFSPPYLSECNSTISDLNIYAQSLDCQVSAQEINGVLALDGCGVGPSGVPRFFELSKTDASDYTPNSVKVNIWTYRTGAGTQPYADIFEIFAYDQNNAQVGYIKYNAVYDSDTINVNFANPAASVYTRNNGYFNNAPTITTSGNFTGVHKLRFKINANTFSIDDLSVGPLNSAPVNTVAPAIIGIATVGNALTGSTGSWTDADGDTLILSRQWYRADSASGTNWVAIASATGTTYTLTTSDAHKYIQLVVSASDGKSGMQTASSAYTQILNSAPVNSAAPTVTGTMVVGNTLSTTNGTWSDADGDGRTYTYQWYRADDNSGTNLAAIGGANSASYTLTASDGQKYLRVVVTANDGHGGTTPINSAYTSAINTLPSDIALSSSSVNQSLGVNAVVGTLSSTDPDVGSTFTYTLVAGAGSTDNALFNISGNSLRVNDASALAAGSYSVRIRTTDNNGAAFEKTFSITLVDDIAPTVTISSNKASLKAGETATITFTMSEPVTSFDTGDVSVTSGSISVIAGSGASYSTTFTPAADTEANATINIEAGGFWDAAGNANTAATPLSITVDTLAPDAPSTPVLSALSDSGVAGDNITNTTTPVFTGTAEAGSRVTLYHTDGITVLGMAIATGGIWSITSGALGEGSHSITAKATDSAGNESNASVARVVTIDTTPHAKPSAPLLAAASDTGDSNADRVTNLTTLTLQGAAGSVEANASVHARSDLQGGLTNTTANADGSWTLVVSNLTEGAHQLAIRATDVAGNQSVYSDPLTVTIDTTVPVLGGVAFDQSSVTADNHSAISLSLISAEVGTKASYSITSSNGGTAVTGTDLVVSSANQQFTAIDVSGLNDGVLSVSLTLVDLAGNTSTAVTDTITKDANAPEVSRIDIASGNYAAGKRISVTITFSEIVTLSGTNSTIALDIGREIRQATYRSKTAKALTYEYIVQANDNTDSAGVIVLADGISLNGSTIRDAAGNDALLTFAQTANSAAQVDTTAPNSAIVTTPAAPVTVNADDYTISGTHVENGLTVKLYLDADNNGVPDNGLILDSAVVSNGTWSLIAPLVGDSANNFVVVAEDAAGNASVAYVPTITEDSIAPNAPVALDLLAVSDTGSSDSDNITRNTEPQLVGTAEPHSTITLTSNLDGITGTAVADALGGWTITSNVLTNGVHTLTATATDAAGNTSEQSMGLNVTIDDQAPTLSSVADQVLNPGTSISDLAITVSDVISDAANLTLSAESSDLAVVPAENLVLGGSGENRTITVTALNSGTATITLTLEDEAGNAGTGTFTVAVNSVPTISGSPATSVNQDEFYRFTPTAIDMDADDVLTFSATGLPAWLSIDSATGALTGTPGNADVGTTTGIVISVNDGELSASLASFDLEVINVNDAPIVKNPIPDHRVNQSTAFSFQFDIEAFIDIDVGDQLHFSASLASGLALPSWLSFTPSSRSFSGTPGNDDVGKFSITVTATDNQGRSVSDTFDITVVNVNDAPTISGTPATTVNQDELYSFTPVASDVDAGDTLTFTATGLPSWLSINPATGAISGTPSNAEVGETDSIVITVTDDAGAEASLPAFTITVVNVNDAPVISGTPTTSVNQGELYSFTPVASDVDEGDTLTFSATGLPNWLSINPATGAISGTPGNADVGETGSIVITVTDDAGEAASLPAFTITVANVNDAPTVTSTPITTATQGELYSYTLIAADEDAGDVLTLSAPTLPSWLNFNPATGVLSGTPTNANVGSHAVVLRATDAAGLYIEQSFTIAVANVNDAPTVTSTPITTATQGELYSYTLIAADEDAGDSTTLSAVTLPDWLDFNPATGVLSGTPTNADVGSHAVVLRATDAAGLYIEQSFTIVVADVNDAPEISGTPATTVNQGELYSFTPVASDVDADDTLIFTATGLPSWLSINPVTGVISGTPGSADVGETGSIVITVTDDAGEAASLPAFTITVANVNDAPIISGTPATTVNQDELYSFTPTASDVDEEDTLTFSITNKPDWAVFDETTGALSGTPAHAHVGITTGIVISVSDGTLTASLPAFNLEVIETIDPLLPVVTAPADITLNATGLYTPVSLRQLLSLNPSVTQEQVEAILNSLASDGVSGNSCCTTHPEGLNDNDLLLLPPGRHEVVWSATNAADVSGTATQVVAINPLVSLSKSQIAIRGSAVEFRVLLNGKAPDYPFAVPYVLDVATTAANTEHSLVSGVAHFTAAGQLAVSVPVSITNLSGLTDSELVVSLDDTINTGAVNTHTISIREGNIAPAVTLQLMQAGVNTTQITPSGGLVTVAATVIDLNSGDTHSYDWSASDRLLGDIDGDPVNHTFVFEPSGLTGRHQVQLAVTDSGGASTSAQLYFRMVDSLPVLLPDADTDGDGIDDETEGFGDSNGNGIPNYLDNMPSSNVLPQQGAVTHAFLLECDPGLRCGVGQFALDSRSGGVQIFDEELASIDGLTVDQTFKPVGGIFDFVINDLPIPGQSARVVIPQQAPIPAEAVYRKYQNGTWVSFLENANNAIHSAPGNVGYCPPPGSPQWTLGLTEGHLCVQLTIEDGGPNDDDGLVNSAIADPGVVSVALPVEPPTPQPPTPEPPKPDIKLTSKGGGAVDGFWILLLGGLLMMQWLRTTRCKGLIALVLLGTSVSSQALTYDQAFVRVDVYKVEGGMRNAEFNQMLNAGYNFTLDNYRADRRGYQIAIGYQWHDYLYTELGYLDLGDVNVDMTLNGETDLPAFKQDLDNIYPRSGKGVTLVQGLTLFSEQPLNVSLEAGAYLWRDDRRTNQTRIKLDDAEGVAPLAGIRLNIELTKTLSLGVNTRRIYLDNETVDLYSLSGRYRF